MLTEAQIEIVDEAGHVEDRVRIVGSGEVALATKGTSRLQLLSDDPTDVDAVISLREGVVTIEAKKHQALRVGDEFLLLENPLKIEEELVAFVIRALERSLHVKVIEFSAASLMSLAGAVIREQPSKLERTSAAAIAKGVVKMREHLARLRARGAIDDRGRLLVPFPADMNPESKTDV